MMFAFSGVLLDDPRPSTDGALSAVAGVGRASARDRGQQSTGGTENMSGTGPSSTRTPGRSDRYQTYGYHNSFHLHASPDLESPHTSSFGLPSPQSSPAEATETVVLSHSHLPSRRILGPKLQQTSSPAADVLPRYTCSIRHEGAVSVRQEFTTPFDRAKDSTRWRDYHAVLQGTKLSLHRLQSSSHLLSPKLRRQRANTPGKLVREYSLQHAEVGVAADFAKTPLAPRSALAKLIPRSQWREAYELDAHLFEPPREWALRLRAEAEQFIMCVPSLDDMLDWCEMLCAAVDIANPLDDRSEPRYRSLPRRNRRRHVVDTTRVVEEIGNSARPGSGSGATEAERRLVEEQERIIARLYPNLGLSSRGNEDTRERVMSVPDRISEEDDDDAHRQPSQANDNHPSSSEPHAADDAEPEDLDPSDLSFPASPMGPNHSTSHLTTHSSIAPGDATDASEERRRSRSAVRSGHRSTTSLHTVGLRERRRARSADSSRTRSLSLSRIDGQARERADRHDGNDTTAIITTTITASNSNTNDNDVTATVLASRPSFSDSYNPKSPLYRRRVPSQSQIVRYRRRCAPLLLESSPRASNVLFCQGKRWIIDKREDRLVPFEVLPPRYESHNFKDEDRARVLEPEPAAETAVATLQEEDADPDTSLAAPRPPVAREDSEDSIDFCVREHRSFQMPLRPPPPPPPFQQQQQQQRRTATAATTTMVLPSSPLRVVHSHTPSTATATTAESGASSHADADADVDTDDVRRAESLDLSPCVSGTTDAVAAPAVGTDAAVDGTAETRVVRVKEDHGHRVARVAVGGQGCGGGKRGDVVVGGREREEGAAQGQQGQRKSRRSSFARKLGIGAGGAALSGGNVVGVLGL